MRLMFPLSVIALFSACGTVPNARPTAPVPTPRPFSLDDDKAAKARLDEIEKRLVNVETRVTALEKALGDLRELNATQAKQIAALEGLTARMDKIEKLGESLSKQSATKDDLEKAFADLQNQLNALKTTTDGLVVSRDEFLVRQASIEAWKKETDLFLANLKTADISAAVADLQTWKAAVAAPLADMLLWKEAAEKRLNGLESLSKSTEACLKSLDPKGEEPTPAPGETPSPCAALKKEVQALAGLYTQVDALSKELNALSERIDASDIVAGEREKAVRELEKALIRTRYSTLRSIRPCGLGTGVFVRLSAREAYTDELVYQGRRRTNGALADGDYTVKDGGQTLCDFKVSSSYRALSDVEGEALGLTGSLRLKKISWEKEDGTLLGFDVLSPSAGEVAR